MKTIHQLPPHVIAKIAAGEVIERPAYAVKELLENAIDAKADSIIIQIEQAGLKKIIVTDNGIGMSYEDIKECFKPHTTSKIRDESNLIGIRSLGFRGEALSSIAAISTMTIKSKTENQTAGTVVQLQTGTTKRISPIGMPTGTSVIVDNLFSNVPARKKFLKTQRTEFRHILEIVMHYAISFPEIRFFLSHNQRVLIDFPKHQDIVERIRMLLGHDIFTHLLPITYQDSYIHISGFISTPQFTTNATNKQIVFVNKRKVTDKVMSLAVKEAYGNLLASHMYPIFIIFITLPAETVDVNIHPRKEQVSFINGNMVFDILRKVVSETIAEKNLTFHYLFDTQKKLPLTTSYAGKLLKDTVLPWNAEKLAAIIKTSPILQLHQLFLVVETNNGMLFIDQHAAHERILFEQFLQEFYKQKKRKGMYQLPKPLSFALSFSDAEVVIEKNKLFHQLGFVIEQLTNTSFTLRAVPMILKDRDSIAIIKEIIDDVAENTELKQIDRQTNRMLTYLACRAAIKAGDILSSEQRKKLVEQLEKTNNNATCPHGRPTKIAITLQELHTLFKRT